MLCWHRQHVNLTSNFFPLTQKNIESSERAVPASGWLDKIKIVTRMRELIRHSVSTCSFWSIFSSEKGILAWKKLKNQIFQRRSSLPSEKSTFFIACEFLRLLLYCLPTH